jgi:tetratricopeptide (TPR) repeat protein
MVDMVARWTHYEKALPPEVDREAATLSKTAMIEYQSAVMGGIGSTKVALSYLEEAARVNPEGFFPRAQLAIIYAGRAGFSMPFTEAQQLAHKYICEALALNPPKGIGFNLGIVNFRGFLDYETAIRNFEQAVGANTSFGQIKSEIAWVLAAQGSLEESIEYLDSALSMGSQLNDPTAYRARGVNEMLLGRYRDAIVSIRQAVEAEAGYSLHSELALAEALYRSGDEEGGLSLLKDLWSKHGNKHPEQFPHLLALMGESELALEVLTELESRHESGRLFYYGPMFEAHYFLGNLDDAFVWLDEAAENGEWLLFKYLRRADYLAPLREDPRFDVVMSRIHELESRGTPDCPSANG